MSVLSPHQQKYSHMHVVSLLREAHSGLSTQGFYWIDQIETLCLATIKTPDLQKESSCLVPRWEKQLCLLGKLLVNIGNCLLAKFSSASRGPTLQAGPCKIAASGLL